MALNIFTLFSKKSSVSKTKEAPGVKTPPQILAEGMLNVRDIIAPSAIEVDFSNIKIGNMYYRTMFVSGYPRFVGANWLSPIINFEHTLLMSMFYYPVKSRVILDDLRRKITELEATTMSNQEKGKITDPVVQAALEDANALQEQLVKGVEKYFQFSFYITIPATSLDELDNISSKLESTLASLLLISKVASLQMEDAFQSSIPTGCDKLLVTRNMDTTSLATTFPFTSSDLTMEEGVMYGINRHNGSLVIFDRFSLENANEVVFAKSGSGKSYYVKLEALRMLIFGSEILIIDPEEEYRELCSVVGGNYIDFSSNSRNKINPFDLSGIAVEGENELGQKLISLITLLKLMLNGLNATEEALLDRALIETYRIKGITADPETQATKEPPVMEDLYKVLLGAEEPEAKGMAERLERFIKGSMTGIFDSQSNINLTSKMTVFSTKNLEEALRPIAFYMILDFVWTTIRKDLKKRIMIVEEAWYLMQNPDSARFIYGIAKRARKYYLGLTTISQDVDDFLTSEYGKAIVTNSSIQMLLKQHPAAIDKVMETFYLSEGEKRFLLGAGVGEGLFFAGANHVAIKVMASDAENKLITTNPEEILKIKKEREAIQKNVPEPIAPRQAYRPYKAPEGMDTYTTYDESGLVKPEFAPKPRPVEPHKKEVPPPVVRPSVKPELKPELKTETKPVLPVTPQIKPQIQQTPQPKVETRPLVVNKTINLKKSSDDEDYINRMPTAGDILDSVEEMRRQKPQQRPNMNQQKLPQKTNPVSIPIKPAVPQSVPQNFVQKPSPPIVPPQQKNEDLDLR
jgi:conjugal transfer ATP-binding protein TraC